MANAQTFFNNIKNNDSLLDTKSHEDEVTQSIPKEYTLHEYHQEFLNLKSIPEALRKAALEWGCRHEEVDYDIIGFKTYLDTYPVDENDVLHPFYVKTSMPKDMTQTYNIIAFKRNTKKKKTLFMQLAINEKETKVGIKIKAGSWLGTLENDVKDIKNGINKLLAEQGYLIGLWSSRLDSMMEELKVKLEGCMKFQLKKSIAFIVSEGLDSIEPVPATFKAWYKEKDPLPQDRVDHSDRGFICEVKEGELLFESQEARKGSYGRNCKGKIFGEINPKNAYVQSPDYDIKSVQYHAEGGRVTLHAKKSGFIFRENKTIEIHETLKKPSITFKNTGDISADDHGAVSLQVGENNIAEEDAIGMGVDIKVKDIVVKGNMGSHSSITADSVEIKGKTHKTSMIKAKDAIVNIHSGTLSADVAQVNRVEIGKVLSKLTKIHDVFSGSVDSDEVHVVNVHKFSTITATKSMYIENILGNENVFKISSVGGKKDAMALQHIKSEVLLTEQELNREMNKFEEMKKIIHEQAKIVETIKEKVKNFRKRNAPIPVAFKTKQIQIKESIANFHKQRAKIDRLEKDIVDKKDMIQSVQSSILDASIYIGNIHDTASEDANFVEFHLSEPKRVLKTTVSAFSSYSLVMEDDQFKIKKSKAM